MNKYLFIILRLLKINFKDFFFLSFNTIYSIVITSLTVVFILITFSVNLSFKEIIKTKIIKHDGYVEIYDSSLNYDNSIIDEENYKLNNRFNVSPLISKEVIVRYKSRTEACYLKMTDFDLDVFNLSDIIVNGKLNQRGLVVGHKLFKKLNLKLNDNLNIIYEKDGQFSVFKIPIVGVFKTSIADFDKYNIYCDLSINDNILFNSPKTYTLNFNDSQKIDPLFKMNEYNYSHYFWYEKYDNFLYWLNSYDYPINLLLMFIIGVCLVNIVSSFYIDSMYRIKDLNLLSFLGMSKSMLSFLLCLRYAVIVFLGCIAGFLIVYFFQLIQNNYSLISIPEYIYYMKYLPVSVNFIHCTILLAFIMVFSFIFNFFIFHLVIKKEIRIDK